MQPVNISYYFQTSNPKAVEAKARQLDRANIDKVRTETDGQLGWLLIAGWAVTLLVAILDPAGKPWIAFCIGAPVACIPFGLTRLRPGDRVTRHAIAVGQMLMASLLVQMTGDRAEAHYAFFCLLASLTFYHDWRVLLTGAALALGDHIVGAFLWTSQSWTSNALRALEYSGWLAFEVWILGYFLIKARRQMIATARHEAELEVASSSVSAQVDSSTKSLRASESRYALVFRNSPLPMWLIEAETKLFIDVNLEASTVFGYTNAQFLDMTLYDLSAPEETEMIDKALQQVLAGKPYFGQWRQKRASGADMDVEVTAHRVDFAGFDAILMLANDVTERRQAARAKEEMEMQLRHAQKLESIGQLASGIAHEINTPTQYIGDNLHFLRDAFGSLGQLIDAQTQALEVIEAHDPARASSLRELATAVDCEYLTDEIPKSLEQALEGVDRVSTLVKAMKEFSHPGRKEKTLADINHAIESTITVTRNEWKYVAHLETDLDPDLPQAPCLISDFNQVLLNLIVNAAQAIKELCGSKESADPIGLIRISTREVDGAVEIRVKDNGGGIPQEIQERIFDPFFTTKEVGSGTGQGLAISRSVIVDKHGGTIDFETEAGTGTTFIIRLPLARGNANEGAEFGEGEFAFDPLAAT